MRRDFPLCLDFGCHDGLLTDEFAGSGKIGTVIRPSGTRICGARRCGAPPSRWIMTELPFAAGSFHAVFSCLLLHWVDDLPGVMAQIRGF